MESSATFRRLTLESLAIVGSILLAFAIDAWWQDSLEEQRRLTLLDDLKTETMVNIEDLRRAIEQQELHAQYTEALIEVMLGMQELTSAEVEELRQKTAIFPTFTPSFGILDLLIASGDLVLVEDKRLRAKLANLKGYIQPFIDNQAIRLSAWLSSPSIYDTGLHLHAWVIPDAEHLVDRKANREQLEVALKTRELIFAVHQLILKEQGQFVLEKLLEIKTLLP
jgi:hypothetical protein